VILAENKEMLVQQTQELLETVKSVDLENEEKQSIC